MQPRETRRGGRIEVRSRSLLRNHRELRQLLREYSLERSMAIMHDPHSGQAGSLKANSVAILSDGSEVRGLGAIGPIAVVPWLESTAILLKRFAHLDGWPLGIRSQNNEEILQVARSLTGGFGAVLLQGIASERALELSERLQFTGIPVMHLEQSCASVLAMAAWFRYLYFSKQPGHNLRVVVEGKGCELPAMARSLLYLERDQPGLQPPGDVVVIDEAGCLYPGRADLVQPSVLAELAAVSNRTRFQGDALELARQSNVWIHLGGRAESAEPGWLARLQQNLPAGSLLIDLRDISTAAEPGELAQATPTTAALPTLWPAPDETWPATLAARIYPGVIAGSMRAGAVRINDRMYIAAAQALARLPAAPADLFADLFAEQLHTSIADAVFRAATQSQLL
ncbi:MAG: hypothetical protein KDK39_02455 [Leptospiraceae bacterium]|nr:hypothetical protein [Leptospiraceae bacterium]